MRVAPNNWADFQHYKDRNPPWIKLHKKLLDNYEFQCLPIASRALAPMLWLIASEDDRGEIDAAPRKLAFRLRMTERELTDALKPLIDNGFFLVLQLDSAPLAECKPDAKPETEAEKRRKEAEARAKDFEIFYSAYPKKEGKKDAQAAWAKVDVPVSLLLDAISRKSKSEDWRKANGQFVPLPATWLRGRRWEDAGVTLPDEAPKGPDPVLEKMKADELNAAPIPKEIRELAQKLKVH
jgi:hypothetical protein